jgi:4-hydroxy-tetrahydrodipicolinate synthase
MSSELIVVVPTFFDHNNDIDYFLMYDHLKYLITSGVRNFVFQGTTSETPTLSRDEIKKTNTKILGILGNVYHNLDELKIIFGVGGFNTDSVIDDISYLDYPNFAPMLMLSAPYYNKPTQEGIFEHFKKITQTYTHLKFMVYNVPSRTGVNIEPSTMVRICKFHNVYAIKEACGNMSQIIELQHLLKLNKIEKVSLYSGDDGLTVPVLSIGGKGIISVLGNLMPKTILNMLENYDNSKLTTVQKYNNDLAPFYKLLFIESNPVPLKYLLSLKYKDKSYYNVRLPLTYLSNDSREVLDNLYYKYLDTEYNNELTYDRYT